jgi:hypothetical protein
MKQLFMMITKNGKMTKFVKDIVNVFVFLVVGIFVFLQTVLALCLSIAAFVFVVGCLMIMFNQIERLLGICVSPLQLLSFME